MLIHRNDSLTDVFSNVSDELHRGAIERNHPFRFVSFATLDKEHINSRLVVLREVQDDLSFVIFTDSRSQKVTDLSENTTATLLFWHAGKKVQVAAQGTVELHQQDALSKKYWAGISIEGRKAYGSAISPGTTVDRPVLAHEWPDEISSEFFCVIVVRPQEMDILQLHKLSHYRTQFKHHDNEWLGSWVAP